MLVDAAEAGIPSGEVARRGVRMEWVDRLVSATEWTAEPGACAFSDFGVAATIGTPFYRAF